MLCRTTPAIFIKPSLMNQNKLIAVCIYQNSLKKMNKRAFKEADRWSIRYGHMLPGMDICDELANQVIYPSKDHWLTYYPIMDIGLCNQFIRQGIQS